MEVEDLESDFRETSPTRIIFFRKSSCTSKSTGQTHSKSSVPDQQGKAQVWQVSASPAHFPDCRSVSRGFARLKRLCLGECVRDKSGVTMLSNYKHTPGSGSREVFTVT